MITRRGFVQLTAAAAAAAALAPRALAKRARDPMNRRTIPRSGATLPIIGLGTWQTFDVGGAAAERAPLIEVLRRFLAAGGELIDSSPMYGRSEEVTGDLLAELKATAFLATKVWTSGKRAGIEQMQRSLKRMRTARMDLMQVHNLLDVRTHLPVLREMKQAGTVTHIGITHYAHSAFTEMERLLRTEKLDFIQLPYNIADRAAEKRLLPAAADTGTAVLVMRPFEEGALFRKVKGVPLPAWAADFDCGSWAQYFLKFICGHPAVTSPIPATSNPDHASDNTRAGHGRLPDAAMRKRMIDHLGL
jgi:aryl-alcohol dehydrogenase-like predicted oxidoreductase